MIKIPWQKRYYLIVTAISVFLVFILHYPRPVGFWSDPAWGLKALQQYTQGKTPSFNHALSASPLDLSKDNIGWIFSWPCGGQIVFFPFIKFGFSIGEAARLVVLIFTLLGCLGWLRWTLRFKIDHPFILFLAAILPWLRFATLPYFNFGADLLIFAVVPWILLYIINLAYTFQLKPALLTFHSALSGLLVGSLYIIKWSAGFVALGILIWQIFDSLKSLKSRRLFSLIVFFIFWILPIVGYSVINKLLGGYANTLTGDMSISLNLNPFIFIGSLGTSGLALFDLESLLNFLFFHPSRPQLFSLKWLGLFGLPCLPIIIWLVKRAFKERIPYKEFSLAIILTVCSLSAMVLLTITVNPKFASEKYWFIYVTRYIRPAVLTLLPVLLLGMKDILKTVSKTIRMILCIAIFIYCIVPCLYSFTAFFVKLKRVSPAYETGPAGVYNPLLSPVSASVVLNDTNSFIKGPRDVVFVTDPVTWLDIEARSFYMQADFMSKEWLLSIGQWQSSNPLRLIMVLPKHFESNNKGLLLRSLVPQAKKWQVYTPKTPSTVNIWYADLMTNDKILPTKSGSR